MPDDELIAVLLPRAHVAAVAAWDLPGLFADACRAAVALPARQEGRGRSTPWKVIRDAVASEPGAEEEIARHRTELLAEIGLFELRRRAALSQVELAARLNVSQSAVSQLERSTDPKLSTVRDYVEGLGGHLQLVAVFDDGGSYPLVIEAASEPAR